MLERRSNIDPADVSRVTGELREQVWTEQEEDRQDDLTDNLAEVAYDPRAVEAYIIEEQRLAETAPLLLPIDLWSEEETS